MVEMALAILAALGTLSPSLLLGTILFVLVGGLAAMIYLQVVTQRGQNVIATNHLHDLPAMAETLSRIEDQLRTMNDNIIYIRARLNGRS
jgi:hypothetical protein